MPLELGMALAFVKKQRGKPKLKHEAICTACYARSMA